MAAAIFSSTGRCARSWGTAQGRRVARRAARATSGVLAAMKARLYTCMHTYTHSHVYAYIYIHLVYLSLSLFAFLSTSSLSLAVVWLVRDERESV